MIQDILKNVESPFSDEMIQELIKTFVLNGCNDDLSYNYINNNSGSKKIESEIKQLIIDIKTGGIDNSDAWVMDKEKIPYIFDENDSWVIIKSEEDPYGENRRAKDNKQPLVYRIYLNVKGKEKIDFVKEYISICKEKNIPFKFKFSKDDKRDDQVIFLSNEELFEAQLGIIEELSKEKELGKIPTFIGRYKENIGIAEEYYYRLYSPTTAKLALVRSSLKKYLCDHRDDFYDQLSEDEKKIVDNFFIEFTSSYELQNEMAEKHGQEYIDSRKCFYQRKNNIECAKEYIETNSDSYVGKDELSKLGDAIIKIYKENPQKFLEEITENFKNIGINVWGFSKKFIFSNETEQKYLLKKYISIEDIESLLEKSENLPELLSITMPEDKTRED